MRKRVAQSQKGREMRYIFKLVIHDEEGEVPESLTGGVPRAAGSTCCSEQKVRFPRCSNYRHQDTLTEIETAMQTFLRGRRVGYWLSEKKMKKLNFQAFADLCRKRGIEVVQLDLSLPLEEQGPLDVIIHKLTDLILEADQNDMQSLLLVQHVQDYIEAHPETIVLDPLPAIRTLLDRCKSYQLIHRIEDRMQDERICSPPFMVLNSECGPDTLEQIRKHKLTFPFICKTRVAHGTNSHEMAIIFSEEDLKNVQPPCVIQSFINHNAVLYKVFVVGESYTVVERPSLRNFPSGSAGLKGGENRREATQRENVEGVSQPPSDDVIRELSRALRQALGVSLFGIDVIINNQTGQHAVIDINAFPGYEGVPEFFNDLLNHIISVLQAQGPESPPSGPVKGSVAGQTPSTAGPASGDRGCASPSSCCSMLGKDASSWIVEGDGGKKSPHQRLGCNSAVSPNFQQHCVSTVATKASSQ
ncbi:inositol-tetrakisphosphate 1-kinase-like [Scleropages formosus]|uniref:Inositol-tetrakisphosphate 1-kinase n=1 Tax=Scleropages formosus TaxID=113540 RepID=A0A0P7V8N3_SCLFO|nr:inositol-tetrakisphosphate 1-kinase-like [Scleropages formosus]